MLTIVSATAHDERTFHENTFLGRSLDRLKSLGNEFDLRVVFSNPVGTGLSEIYNRALAADESRQIMLLVHDDVSLEDMLLERKLNEAIRSFDLIGTAGANTPPGAPFWYDANWKPSGCVPHADRNRPDSLLEPNFMYFGPCPQACTTIDGHFMVVVPERIARSGAKFDLEFTYHHYDLAFCQSANAAGLRIGTWPIFAVHGSGGGYQTQAWKDSRRLYVKKYPLA